MKKTDLPSDQCVELQQSCSIIKPSQIGLVVTLSASFCAQNYVSTSRCIATKDRTK